MTKFVIKIRTNSFFTNLQSGVEEQKGEQQDRQKTDAHEVQKEKRAEHEEGNYLEPATRPVAAERRPAEEREETQKRWRPVCVLQWQEIEHAKSLKPCRCSTSEIARREVRLCSLVRCWILHFLC